MQENLVKNSQNHQKFQLRSRRSWVRIPPGAYLFKTTSQFCANFVPWNFKLAKGDKFCSPLAHHFLLSFNVFCWLRTYPKI